MWIKKFLIKMSQIAGGAPTPDGHFPIISNLPKLGSSIKIQIKHDAEKYKCDRLWGLYNGSGRVNSAHLNSWTSINPISAPPPNLPRPRSERVKHSVHKAEAFKLAKYRSFINHLHVSVPPVEG